MLHIPVLIQDLGFILITAAIVTLICKYLKQPVVLGYLIAGFLVSPHVPFVFTVSDTESIKVWAEIGVIFLLFGLGLEFSFKKLAKVGKSATLAGLSEIGFMLGAGYLTGQMLGWSKMDSLFLGGILSVSSTTIIVRAFDELGMKGRNFVSLVFGILIVEDLVAILLLVLLSSVAATQSLSGTELFSTSSRLIFFMVLWFLLGIYVLPIFLRKVEKFLSDETTLIVSIGLCLLMVMIATNVGFSPALGAFVMGSLLAETKYGHRIEGILIPVRDLFAAVFFVSVGMMIDPKVLYDYFGIIILMTVITIVGKLISSSVGALISGRSLKTSVQAGMSLAQIGEFSFIIATLGVSLKVTSDFLYPIAVAVSAVTTFTTPYMIKYCDPLYAELEKRIPKTLKDQLARYETAMATSSGKNVFALLWNEYGIKIFFNSVIVVAIGFAMTKLALPRVSSELQNYSWMNFLIGLVTLTMSAPFLWAILFGRPSHTSTYSPETVVQLKRLQFGIILVRLIIGTALIGFIVSRFSTEKFSTSHAAALGLIIALVIIGVYFSKLAEPFYRAVEKKFLSNLNEREKAELAQANTKPELAPWDASLTEFIISPHSPVIGKSLQQSRLKETYGVTVAMIERGNKQILAPGREDILFPYDKIFLIGTDDQLRSVKEVLEIEKTVFIEKSEKPSYGLASLFLKSEDQFINRSIRECGLREAVNGLIVGVEREGQRLLNPDSGLELIAGDLIWLVGDLNKIQALKK